MASKESKARVAKAFRAMKDLGIPQNKVKPVLKSLLVLYEKNWQLIEEENYRALADAIFEREEAEAVKQSKKIMNTQVVEDNLDKESCMDQEHERPLKRLRRKNQDDPGSSSRISSNPQTPLLQPKEEKDVLPEPPLLPPTDQNVMPSPSRSLRKIQRQNGHDPSRVQSVEKRPEHANSSLALVLKEPKIEPITSLPPKEKNARMILMKPKEEPVFDDRVDVYISHPRSCAQEPLERWPSNGKEADTGTSSQNEPQDDSEMPLSSGRYLEIASSPSGEVKMLLSLNLASDRNTFHMPKVETVLNLVQETCLRSDLSCISMSNILSKTCQHFLELGTNSNSVSPKPLGVGQINEAMNKSSAACAQVPTGLKLNALNGSVGSLCVAEAEGQHQPYDGLTDVSEPNKTSVADVQESTGLGLNPVNGSVHSLCEVEPEAPYQPCKNVAAETEPSKTSEADAQVSAVPLCEAEADVPYQSSKGRNDETETSSMDIDAAIVKAENFLLQKRTAEGLSAQTLEAVNKTQVSSEMKLSLNGALDNASDMQTDEAIVKVGKEPSSAEEMIALTVEAVKGPPVTSEMKQSMNDASNMETDEASGKFRKEQRTAEEMVVLTVEAVKKPQVTSEMNLSMNDALDNARNMETDEAIFKVGKEQRTSADEMVVLTVEAVKKPAVTSDIILSLNGAPDIAKGKEKIVVTVVNEVNDELPPAFCYITQNAVFQNAFVNFSLSHIRENNSCSSCSGDCLSLPSPCGCARKSGCKYPYTSGGLLKDELLSEYVSMNRNPKKHCQFFCKECPIERLKCEDAVDPCKGHLIRKIIKECSLKCGCGNHCGNRVVQRGLTRHLQVFMTSEGRGWGLRALEDLPKGAFVCEYVGEILTITELRQRALRHQNEKKLSYPMFLDAGWGHGRVLKDKESLSLDTTYYGNAARFINHRCYDANLVGIPVEVESPDHDYYRLAFFTTRKVDAMEELTRDYGIDFDDYDHPFETFECRCGSRFCWNIKRTRSRCSRK